MKPRFPITRRQLIASGVSLCAAPPRSAIDWYDAAGWSVEGKGWTDTEGPYDRLPVRARTRVPGPVWSLSHDSAGLRVRFRTDSPSIALRMDLSRANLSMPHMPATGVSGFDLYLRMPRRWQWVHNAMPASQHIEAELIRGLAPGPKEFMGYLPLYNGVDRLEIGVDAGARFEPIPADPRKPIVFYGTSICQGACASRPGVAYTAILGRRLNSPFINLGFSGSGRMDEGVVELISELDASVFVIDCLPNMDANLVKERTAPLVKRIRSARTSTPILLVEDRTFAQAPAAPGLLQSHRERRKELTSAFRRLREEGVLNLHYMKGDPLLGDDSEGTTDGSHPNDLGMMRYAEALRPILGRLIRARE